MQNMSNALSDVRTTAARFEQCRRQCLSFHLTSLNHKPLDVSVKYGTIVVAAGTEG